MEPDNGEARALRTLGLLTRGALHEISNPLLALVGSAELALSEAEEGTKLHGRLALVHSTGSEIARIVRALQGFLRLQGEPEATLSVGEQAAEAVALVELLTPLRGRAVVARGDATVTRRPGPLRAALVELLLEAIDRTEPGELVELVVEDGAVRATGGGELRL